MFSINSSRLLKTVPTLLLGYTLQAGAEITTSADSKHLIYRVPINKSLLINLDRNVSKLTKGNESIADLTLVSPRQLLLRGHSIGGTNATIWDSNNKLAMVIDVEVTHNLDALKQKLYELMPNEPIQVRGAEKCIILSGEVSSLVNLDYAMKLAQGYASTGMGGGGSGSGGGCGGSGGSSSGGGGGGGGGGNTSQYIVNMMHVGGEQQVMLEVKIAEVSRNLARELTLRSRASKSTTSEDGSFIWTALSAGAGFFTGSYVTGNTLFNWSLNFTRNTDLATVLAEPNLTTISGKSASFLSGGQFPYTACTPGSSGTGTTNSGTICTVAFKPFGVGLEFTPVVLDSNRINLTTHVSVSALSNRANEILSSTDTENTIFQPTPTLDSREAITTLELTDGQTMSIAGLISENQSNTQQQTPGLADIPVLGSLFRNRSSRTEKKELVILITPHLAKPVPLDQISLPTDNYVQPNDIDFYLLGRQEDRKAQSKIAQAPVFDPTIGGTTGQFGHQVNNGDLK